MLDEQEPGGYGTVMERPAFCASCGAALKPGARFCETCGKPVMVAPVLAVEAKAAAAAPETSQAVGQRSPDGKWWWNGTQWVAMPQAVASAIAPCEL